MKRWIMMKIMNVKKRITIKKKIRMERYCEDAGEEEVSNGK
jgi:hypothetical protein